jgi:carbon-monoxide dehydrogenase small subunit
VEVVTDFTLTGRLARFGRGGMIEDVSNRLLGDFVDCLQRSIVAPASVGAGEETAPQAPVPPTQPIRGVRLLLSVVWERIKRFFRRLFGG